MVSFPTINYVLVAGKAEIQKKLTDRKFNLTRHSCTNNNKKIIILHIVYITFTGNEKEAEIT